MKILFLIVAITDEITKSPDINTDRQLIKKRPIEKGIVNNVISNITPKTKLHRYAGTCANLIIIANFANKSASQFLNMLTKKQTKPSTKTSTLYSNNTTSMYKALLPKIDSIIQLNKDTSVEKKIVDNANNAI